jgi:hypothetical protein
VQHLLAVVFGAVSADAESELRARLGEDGIGVALLTGALAESLAADNGRAAGLPPPGDFSFARLRHHVRGQVHAAPWWKHFQPLSVQPGRLMALQRDEAALAEADLFRAATQGSCLLLGEPGAGKTTSLRFFAESLAGAGGSTPVFLPLGRYQGDFWEVLCEALAPGAEPVLEATARDLVESGALVLLLDGLNEVQDPDLHAHLVQDLNRLTAPDAASARSRWIVLGRVHDYDQDRYRLDHLEARRWELQPLTADLIFRFLADALGEARGKAVYEDLGDTVREVCANPLLLNMVLTVHRETGRAPASRGALYRRFVDLLLDWGEERGLGAAERETLAAQFPEPMTTDRYRGLAQQALTALATAMPTTAIRWAEAQRHAAAALGQARNPAQAAQLLLDDLTRPGLLRLDVSTRVSFFHHTVQEYFQARSLLGQKPEELIPRGGAPANQRERIAFLAGLLEDPAPLMERALQEDPKLAFQIYRDAPEAIPAALTDRLASRLWEQTQTTAATPVCAANRRWAILFRRLVAASGTTIEALVARIDGQFDQGARAARLLWFYAELGDVKAGPDVLSREMVDGEVPARFLFEAGRIATDSRDNQRAVELLSRYLESNPQDAAAFNNRGNAYQARGQPVHPLSGAESGPVQHPDSGGA